MNWDYNLDQHPGRPAGECLKCEHFGILATGEGWCSFHVEYVEDSYSCYDFKAEEELI